MSDFGRTTHERNLFLALAVGMSWKLALAVIVPIVGGYKLDQQLHTAPVLTVVGFLVTIALVILVLRSVVQQSARRSGKLKQDNKR